MEVILIILTLIYCSAVLVVLFKISAKRNDSVNNTKTFISIVIAARNEEQRIRPTLESLSRIHYAPDQYEVIFVDDASTDNTATVISDYVKEKENWNLISIPVKDKTLLGKKAALKEGLARARGKIILTTDADCVIPPHWPEYMVSVFAENTNMVLGHALLMKQNSWLNRWLRFDNLFSGILAAATTLLGFPMSSVGRNMAYRREAYIDSGGYDQLASHKSGDDVHLTELFRRKVNGKIKFNLNKESFIISRPPDSFRETLQQQIRKNSKILKKSFPSILVSLTLFVYHIMLLVFPFLFPEAWKFWLILLLIKLCCEFLTLIVCAQKFSERSLLPFIPFMQVIYPIYVSVLGLVGLFQIYEWKK